MDKTKYEGKLKGVYLKRMYRFVLINKMITNVILQAKSKVFKFHKNVELKSRSFQKLLTFSCSINKL